jgi:hypothetical protein
MSVVVIISPFLLDSSFLPAEGLEQVVEHSIQRVERQWLLGQLHKEPI